MVKYVGKDFTGRTQALDGNHFHECNFTNATLVFSGGTPPLILGCNLQGARFTFEGPAANTTQFLRSMARDPGMAPAVRKTFPELLQTNAN